MVSNDFKRPADAAHAADVTDQKVDVLKMLHRKGSKRMRDVLG